jgi:hypothetical protein
LKKNFFEIGRAGYQKKRNFALISKMCRSLEFGRREKNFYRTNTVVGTWKILQNQRKIPLLLIPCTPNFEEIFFQLFGPVFLEVKSSKKIETDQYFKNAFL